MKLWKPDPSDPDFDLTPMIDVVFLLIAFFMMLISFISQELIQLELPIAEEAKVPEEKRNRQFVSVQEDGTLYFGAFEVTQTQLTQKLRAAKQANPELKVYLRAAAKVPHRHVNKVMEACGEAGIRDLIFGTKQS